jgi:hypothetical protein
MTPISLFLNLAPSQTLIVANLLKFEDNISERFPMDFQAKCNCRMVSKGVFHCFTLKTTKLNLKFKVFKRPWGKILQLLSRCSWGK